MYFLYRTNFIRCQKKSTLIICRRWLPWREKRFE